MAEEAHGKIRIITIPAHTIAGYLEFPSRSRLDEFMQTCLAPKNKLVLKGIVVGVNSDHPVARFKLATQDQKDLVMHLAGLCGGRELKAH